MRLRYALVTTIVLALAGVAHATGCSGGTDGGMDATGSQCNQAAPAMEAAPAPAAGGQPGGATRSPSTATRAPSKSERHTRTRIAQVR